MAAPTPESTITIPDVQAAVDDLRRFARTVTSERARRLLGTLLDQVPDEYQPGAATPEPETGQGVGSQGGEG